MPQRPDPTPFDPEIGARSPVLEALVYGPAAALSAVLLVVGENAAASGFAARAAIAIADAWTGSGRQPLLVDLSLDEPGLHTLLGARNDEGIADAFAFGTSLRLLARDVDGHGFQFVPAGLATDARAVLAAGEWRRLIAAEGAAGHALLLYVPANAPGIETLANKVGAAIVIRDSDDPEIELARPYAVVAILQPVATEKAASEQPGPARATPPLIVDDVTEVPRAEAGETTIGSDYDRIRVPREGAGRESLLADLRHRQRDALLAPPSDADATPSSAHQPSAHQPSTKSAHQPSTKSAHQPATPTGTLPGEPMAATRKPKKGRRHPIAWTILVVLLVGVLAGAWHYYGSTVTWPWQEVVEPPAPRQSTAIPPLDSLAMVPLPFVVAVEAHQQLEAAEQRVAVLNGGGAASFFVAPLVREDRLFYHVFAGPLKDSASAAAMQDTLLARNVKTGSTPGDVRRAPLSFLVGDFTGADDAAERVAELRETGIPAYVINGTINGRPRWRVYAGAYGSAAESDVMRQLLGGAGMQDSLVTRMGRSKQ